MPRFNQDEYTTEEESFLPNTRPLIHQAATSYKKGQKRLDDAAAAKRPKHRRPMSITFSET